VHTIMISFEEYILNEKYSPDMLKHIKRAYLKRLGHLLADNYKISVENSEFVRIPNDELRTLKVRDSDKYAFVVLVAQETNKNNDAVMYSPVNGNIMVLARSTTETRDGSKRTPYRMYFIVENSSGEIVTRTPKNDTRVMLALWEEWRDADVYAYGIKAASIRGLKSFRDKNARLKDSLEKDPYTKESQLDRRTREKINAKFNAEVADEATRKMAKAVRIAGDAIQRCMNMMTDEKDPERVEKAFANCGKVITKFGELAKYINDIRTSQNKSSMDGVKKRLQEIDQLLNI